MTDQFSFGSAPEAGQPSSDNVQQDAAPPEQPQYVTRADLEAFSKQFTEDMRRTVQSLTDKQENRIEKKLVDAQKKMQELGVQMTPQMLDNARARLVEAELQRVIDEDDRTPNPVTDSYHPAVVEFVRKQANAICDEVGVKLDNNDPEARMVNFQEPDPEKFLEAVRAAAIAKRARIGQTPSGARAPMAVSGHGQVGGLMDQYLNEITKVQPGSEAAMQIRRKYRAKGLNL